LANPKQFFNGAVTTSSAAITATQTTITGQSTATWSPAGDYIVRIDGFAPGTSQAIFEDVLVTANAQATGVLTVTRNLDSTSQQAFAAGATLTPIISSKMITDAFARLDNNGIQLPTSIGGTLPATGYGTVPVKIDDILVGTDSRYPAATNQITFLNTSNSGTNLLPTGFRHLLIEWYARGDSAAVTANLAARFNNISTATYDTQYQQGSAAVNTSAESLTQTSMLVGQFPAATATANYFGSGDIKVMYYQGTVGNKIINSRCQLFYADTTGTGSTFHFCGKWRTPAVAITRLDLLPSAGNFIVGSLFTLWGLP
jgi:hypothetical protein